MNSTEGLREALLNLEEARAREVQQRRMAEALLAGLRVIVSTENTHEMFLRLFDVMREALDFTAAFVLILGDDGLYIPTASSDKMFNGTVWKPESMFNRVIEGQPVAVFDTRTVKEWCAQPENVRNSVRSALHFSIHTSERKALFICTHSNRSQFSRNHIELVRRFSMLTIQALQKMEAERKLADLEAKLRIEEKITVLNMKLMESEKRLARAKKMEAIGTLAGGVAHDLNNVLSAQVSFPDLILLDLPEDSPLRKPIQIIQESGIKAAAIVQDLLTLARRGVVTSEVTDLNSIVNAYLHSPECGKLKEFHPDAVIESNLEPDLMNILGSSVHLGKSIMNLVSNAAEAMPEGGSITVSTENRYIDKPIKGYDFVEEGDYVILIVSDTGTGIPQQDLDRIFDPFYTKKVMGRSGTGLGMAVVWGMIKDHKGYIDVHSVQNEGTTFTLYFPVTRKQLPARADSLSMEDYMGSGETVLVVDDVKEQREIASQMLRKLGYIVSSVSSGDEAVEYLSRNSVDVLVLDMIMEPGIDGLDTYIKVLEIHPAQKAVIASGYSETTRVREAQRLGAGTYIRKPYTLEKIGLAVKKELKI